LADGGAVEIGLVKEQTVNEHAKGDLRLFGWIRAELARELRLAGREGAAASLPPLVLWAVACWVHEGCTRPATRGTAHHWGESPEHRRRRDGHDWLLFSSRACAEGTLLSKPTVQRAMRQLIRLGLVASYAETERPPAVRDGHGQACEPEWFGPNTQIVRVVLQPSPRAKATPSWVAS
jgi:hypothetical protein